MHEIEIPTQEDRVSRVSADKMWERGNKTRRSKVTVQLKGQQPISITVNKSVQVNVAVDAYIKANVHS